MAPFYILLLRPELTFAAPKPSSSLFFSSSVPPFSSFFFSLSFSLLFPLFYYYVINTKKLPSTLGIGSMLGVSFLL
jgi:hypothetical protein